jgi:catalase
MAVRAHMFFFSPTFVYLFALGLDAHRYRIGINHKQLPINSPINPVANFLRDGQMSFNNQGSRPNFASTQGQDQLQLTPRPYNDDNHTTWVGGAVKYVSQPTELDFELPRIFVSFHRIHCLSLFSCAA